MASTSVSEKRRKASSGRTSFYLTAALLAACVSVFICIKSGGIGDSDYFWHIVLGRTILETGSIPKSDPFSWLSPEMGLVETAHSWLGSILIFLASRVSENPLWGFYLMVFSCSFVFALLAVRFWTRKIQDSSLAILITTLCTSFLSWAARPQNFGMILFVIGFYLLNDAYEYPDSRKCWFLPLLSLVWANLHGGTLPILFAFSALYIVMSFLPSLNAFGLTNTRGDYKPRAKRLILIFLAELAAGLVNPYGIRLYIYFCVTNDSATKKFIQEWQPAYAVDPVFFFCLAMLFVVIASGIKIPLKDILPVMACLFMTMVYMRIRNYLLIVMIPVFSDFLCRMLTAQETKFWKSGGLQSGKWEGKTRRNWIAVTALLLVASLIYLPYTTTDDFTIDEKPITKDVLSPEFEGQLKNLDLKRMYTTYTDGGIVIYHGMQSFVDSRADLFPGDVIKDCIQFSMVGGEDENNMQRILDQYQFDGILINRVDYPAAVGYLNLHPDWEPAIEDDYYILYLPVADDGL